jgi:hypothetical protein
LGHVSGRVNGGTIDRCPAPLQWRSRFCVPMTRLKQKERRTGFRQSGRDRSTILARARFQPCYCHLHEVQTGHPSPSAHQFRLPFNGLAPSELRRLCSNEGACVRAELMRARAQATVRGRKKRPELQAHSRFGNRGGCGLPVATGAELDSALVTPYNAPFPTYKAARFHHAARQRGGSLAARGTRSTWERVWRIGYLSATDVPG